MEDKHFKLLTRLEVQQEFTVKSIEGFQKEMEKINQTLSLLVNIKERMDKHSSDIKELQIESKERREWQIKAIAIVTTLSTIGGFIFNKIF